MTSVATAFAVGKELKKSCVLVADAPAFVVNRLLIRYLSEITRAVDEGSEFEVADRAMNPLGLPMTPFSLLQLVGMGVAAHTSASMHEAFPDRYYLSPNLQRMLDEGLNAVWVCNDDGTATLDPSVAEVYQRGDTVPTRTRSAPAPSTHSPMRLVGCWMKVSWPRPKTSTCA